MHLKNLPQSIKRKTVHTWRQFKESIKLHENFFRQARGRRIVVYHGICEKDHLKFNGIFLRRQSFEKHLQFYQKYFNIVSLTDFYKENLSEKKFNICITFDDGYYNNCKYVLPVMEKYKVPITFFITAIRDAGYDILWNDYLGILTKYGPRKIKFNNDEFYKTGNTYTSLKTKRPFAELLRKRNFSIKQDMMRSFADIVSYRNRKGDEDFWQQMNANDIEALAASAFATIGAHGYYHNDMAEITIEESRKELIESKAFLEKLCNRKINTFAFPYGHYTREVVAEAKQAGYAELLALNFHFSEDKSDNAMRERMIVNPYITIVNQMYAIVKGSYE